MLPVELLYFSATPKDNSVQLQWATATELNNAGFHIERSTDGLRFDAIAEVAGAGTTQVMRQYDAVDREPRPGLSYYRLRQTDIDGSETWSEAVAVEISGKRLLAYPNPVRSVLTISGAADSGTVQVDLFDHLGRSVMQHTSNDGPVLLDLSALPAGAYHVRVTTDAGSEAMIVIKE